MGSLCVREENVTAAIDPAMGKPSPPVGKRRPPSGRLSILVLERDAPSAYVFVVEDAPWLCVLSAGKSWHGIRSAILNSRWPRPRTE